MTPRERRLIRLLHIALGHIETELAAVGYDEVKDHPILRGKEQFLTRTQKALREMEAS